MTTAPWSSATSSVITGYRYDAERRVLEVKSKRTGKIRDYYCTPDQHEAFLRAWSKGRFLAGLDKLEQPSWRRRLRLIPH
jgi:hypothetical protein